MSFLYCNETTKITTSPIVNVLTFWRKSRLPYLTLSLSFSLVHSVFLTFSVSLSLSLSLCLCLCLSLSLTHSHLYLLFQRVAFSHNLCNNASLLSFPNKSNQNEPSCIARMEWSEVVGSSENVNWNTLKRKVKGRNEGASSVTRFGKILPLGYF